MHKRKLIEVALPLEAISSASQAEKNRKVGKPQNLHHWWSRKPITSARALLLAQLIDDPSSDAEAFPNDALVRAERERRLQLIERSVAWNEVMGGASLLNRELAALLPDDAVVVDPFVGGGSLALAAAQFGLDSRSSDLNPVAVLLSKALVEIPSRFAGTAPVNPGIVAEQRIGSWTAATGLAADVEAYAAIMRERATAELGHLYPRVDGYQVLAWVWTRTVRCPNPACGVEMPLASKWWLSKKKGREVFVQPYIVEDNNDPSGRRVKYRVAAAPDEVPSEPPMVGSKGAICVSCGAAAPKDFIKDEGSAGRIGLALTAAVLEGKRRRIFVDPPEGHEELAAVPRSDDGPGQELGFDPRNLWTPAYGLKTFDDLFTSRQLLSLTTLARLVGEVRGEVVNHAVQAGMGLGSGLEAGGTGAQAYGDAVAIYLGLSVSRLADWSNSLCSWEATGEVSQHLFTGQSIPMAWDISEANVLGDGSSGSFAACVKSIVAPLRVSTVKGRHSVTQLEASRASLDGAVIVTDPPYFDNISYADLSDFFYVWQRLALKEVMPDLFGTVLVPKGPELVANPYRAGGVADASKLFVEGFREVFREIYDRANSDYPVVVYYASKSVEKNALGGGNSRWSSILQAIVDAGWQVVRTWPLRTENASRAVAQGNNSLSTSTVMVLRPRPAGAVATDRSGFLNALVLELNDALATLQSGRVAPVDLQQAAIGPGMEVFSRYGAVLEADGTPMPVASALARINDVLDQVMNEQEGEFDPVTRFAIAWFRLQGYSAGDYGDANNVANARDTSVATMERAGILTSRGGLVQLTRPSDLDLNYDVTTDASTGAWEVLHHLIRVLERDGIAPAGDFLRAALNRRDGAVQSDLVLDLSHLLFRIAEGNGWTKEALSFNTLVTSWPEIVEVARSAKKPLAQQGVFDFDEGDE